MANTAMDLLNAGLAHVYALKTTADASSAAVDPLTKARDAAQAALDGGKQQAVSDGAALADGLKAYEALMDSFFKPGAALPADPAGVVVPPSPPALSP